MKETDTASYMELACRLDRAIKKLADTGENWQALISGVYPSPANEYIEKSRVDIAREGDMTRSTLESLEDYINTKMD